jgi:hypothetical protein
MYEAAADLLGRVCRGTYLEDPDLMRTRF